MKNTRKKKLSADEIAAAAERGKEAMRGGLLASYLRVLPPHLKKRHRSKENHQRQEANI